MAKKVTVYDIVLSCPGDVIEEKNIIEDQIKFFNRTVGEKLGIRLDLKHWSTDSYSQSGGAPQDLLNNQFINEADMIIGIFANRIGTPTEKYESGTVEEIQEAIKNDKQVFLYFSDVPVKTSEIDLDQKQSVREFREKVEREKLAYFKQYDSYEDFEEIILSDLSFYFLDFDRKSKNNNFQLSERKSQLLVKSIKNGKVVNGIVSQNIGRIMKQYAQKLKSGIESSIDKINSIHIAPKSKRKETAKGINPALISSLQSSYIEKSNFKLSDEIVSKIKKYGENEKVDLEDNFFELGNLSKITQPNLLNGGYTSKVSGTDGEKEKYKKTEQVYEEILRLEEWLDLADDLDSLHFIPLCLSNEGKVYDTEITVKVILEKSNFVDLTELPKPGPNIIDEINESNLIEILLGTEKSAEISEYSNGTHFPQSPNLDLPGFNPKYVKSYQDKARKFTNNMESIRDYELFEDEENYILEYYFKEIKQHTSISFPSKIALNNKDSNIRYQIISRENPDVVEGILEFQ